MKQRKEYTMKAKVDRNTCIGSENCVTTCPEVFEMNEGKSRVKVDTVPQEAEDTCRQAAEGCPVQAISVEA